MRYYLNLGGRSAVTISTLVFIVLGTLFLTGTASAQQWMPLDEFGVGWKPGPNPVDEVQYRISDGGYVELKGLLNLVDAKAADESGGRNIYRMLLRLPNLARHQYVFNHHGTVRTERQNVGYGQAHRMELTVYDGQLTFPYTEVQNPVSGLPVSVTLYGLRIPIE